jgi:hypothetical protein
VDKGARDRTNPERLIAEIFQGARRVRLNLLGGMTGGVLSLAAGRGKEGTASGAWGIGPWAGSGFGPNRFPWPFSSFPFSF